jgi:hypothetical protein
MLTTSCRRSGDQEVRRSKKNTNQPSGLLLAPMSLVATAAKPKRRSGGQEFHMKIQNNLLISWSPDLLVS